MNYGGSVFSSRQNKSSLMSGLVFIILFVVQQVVAFTWMPFKLVSPYWILYIVLIAYMFINNVRKVETYKSAVLFFLIIMISSILTIINGDSIGSYIVKILYSLIGLVGLYYISTHHINLTVFDILFPVLYIFFYFSYFVFDIFTRQDLNGDLFGHSSSNTIAISLNVIWIIYYIVARADGSSTKSRMLLLFSILNLLLIVVQGSRAGIVVAAINLIMVISDIFKLKYLYFIILLFGSVKVSSVSSTLIYPRPLSRLTVYFLPLLASLYFKRAISFFKYLYPFEVVIL